MEILEKDNKKDFRDFIMDLHKETDSFSDWYFARYTADPIKNPLKQTEERWDELLAEFIESELGG